MPRSVRLVPPAGRMVAVAAEPAEFPAALHPGPRLSLAVELVFRGVHLARPGDADARLSALRPDDLEYRTYVSLHACTSHFHHTLRPGASGELRRSARKSP